MKTQDGSLITIVPHRLTEYAQLRNAGLNNVPHPMDHQYNWPIKQGWEPKSYQKDTAKFITCFSRALVGNSMGTGKTLATAWAADFLMQSGYIRKALICCPVSVMEDTWAEELRSNLKHRTFAILHGTKQQRLKRLSLNVDFFIINHDGLVTMQEEIIQRTDIDLMVLDEASVVRNVKTVYNAVKYFVKPYGKDGTLKRNILPWLWMLTATPSPKELADAWAISDLLDNPSCPPDKKTLKLRTMRQINGRWYDKTGGKEYVAKLLSPAIRFDRKDCTDIPQSTHVYRKCELSTQQKNAFRMMQDRLTIAYDQGEIIAENAAVKTTKLLQIVSGFVKDTDNDRVLFFDTISKLQELRKIIEECDQKLLVFQPFKAGNKIIHQYLDKLGYKYLHVDGDVPIKKRDEIFKEFRHNHEYKILNAHPQCMAHGLNLEIANYVVWFSPIYKNEIYTQANGRVDRMNQKHGTWIQHLYATSWERNIYKALENQTAVNNAILDNIANRNFI